MACTQPRVRIQYSKRVENKQGGWHYAFKFLGPNQIQSYEQYQNWEEKPSEWRSIWEGKKRYMINKIDIVPCGYCESCRIQRSKENATKCVLESKEYPDGYNWFITYTYNDEHLPMIDEMVNEKTGEIYEDDGTWNGTLVKEHRTKYWKDTRNYWDYHFHHNGIRFFECGEYGGTTGRSHYHAIGFNFPINKEDLVFYKFNRNKQPIWTCDKVAKLWQDEKGLQRGFVTIAKVNWQTCAYVARYCTKKMYGEYAEDYYKSKGQIPEFINMSRKPGIGRAYYDENWEKIYKDDEIILEMKQGLAQAVPPCKYYDRLFDVEHHEELEQIKAKRKEKAIENKKVTMSKMSISEKEYNEIKERTLHEKFKHLKRDEI